MNSRLAPMSTEGSGQNGGWRKGEGRKGTKEGGCESVLRKEKSDFTER